MLQCLLRRTQNRVGRKIVLHKIVNVTCRSFTGVFHFSTFPIANKLFLEINLTSELVLIKIWRKREPSQLTVFPFTSAVSHGHFHRCTRSTTNRYNSEWAMEISPFGNLHFLEMRGIEMTWQTNKQSKTKQSEKERREKTVENVMHAPDRTEKTANVHKLKGNECVDPNYLVFVHKQR